MTSEKRVQPDWLQPTSGLFKGLRVANSLKLDEEVDFRPQEGNLVRWYTCGPTVYDSSHLGHARTYLTFDIIRRIVEDYFHYDIFYCMNITDIDDKIILRSRRNYFYDQYKQSHPTLSEDVRSVLKGAWEQDITNLDSKIARNLKDQKDGSKSIVELQAALGLLKDKLSYATSSLTLLLESPAGSPSEEHFERCRDQLSAALDEVEGDKLDSNFMKQLTDQHSKKFEREFFEDMKALGIKPPDVVVRVSEYVSQVISMVQQIISNGFAYVTEGSVYFDTAKFHRDEGHVYGKLAPWSIGNLELLAEGEGALMASGVRKSPKDFALWKSSKPGEPSWASPWGLGRPGWHIECSAMAGEILGPVLDVHCGGADLKFPHHDNELAQSEASFGVPQWVNYFLHSGHLDIDGLKMSKSLKNFITIREALADYTPRQLRFLFILQSWDKVKDTMVEVSTKEKLFAEFFQKVKSIVSEREADVSRSEAWIPRDVELHQEILRAQTAVHKALCSNFDTAGALAALTQLVNRCNSYMVSNQEKKALLLLKASDFVLKILRVFGIDFGQAGSSTSAVDTISPEVREQVARPFVEEIASIRKLVRAGAKNKESHSYFLDLTDQLRDDRMPQHGVRLVDDNDFNFFFVDKDELIAEIAAAKKQQNEGAKAKKIKNLTSKRAAVQKDIEKWLKYAVTPAEAVKARFNVDVSDILALPDLDLSGKELSGSAKKQIPKLWLQQRDNHEKYLAEISNAPNFMDDLRKAEAQLTEELESLAKE